MIDYQGAREAIEQFEAWCRLDRLTDEAGLIHLPPLLTDWVVYVDAEKADRVPVDNRDHLVQLYGPKGYGHMWTNVRLKPKLRVVG